MFRQKRVLKSYLRFSPDEYELNGHPDNSPSASSMGAMDSQFLDIADQPSYAEDTENTVTPCAICSDFATGFHYKCMTCEGCKGFFRRTIQRNLAETYVCKTGKNNCVITKENRGRCQACRYAKCINAGMVGDLVLSFEERKAKQLLITENRKRRRNTDIFDSSLDYGGVNNLSSDYRNVIVKAYNDCYETSQFLDPLEITSSWQLVTSLMDIQLDMSHSFFKLASLHLAKTANFIDKITNMREMVVSDKLLLLGNCGLKVFLFRATMKLAAFLKSETRMSKLTKDVTKVNAVVGNIYQKLRFPMVYLSRQSFDDTEIALFATLLLFQSDECKSLLNPFLVNCIQGELENNILEHSQSVYGSERNRDDLMFGNCIYLHCVSSLFEDKDTLFNIDMNLPTSIDMLNFF